MSGGARHSWDDGMVAVRLTARLPTAEASAGWLALPPGGPVRLLVPRSTPAAAAPALRHLVGHGNLARRVGVELGAQAVRLVGPALLRRSSAWDTVGDRLVGLARALSGFPDAVGVIRLNPGRPNHKPVIQLLRPDLETTCAYVKVGWDDVTAPLVRAEAATLQTLATPPGLAVPELLGADLGDIPAIAVAPVASGTGERPTATELAPLGVELFPTTGPSVPLRTAPLVRDLLADLAGRSGIAVERLTGHVRAFVAIHGDTETPLGRWHGDFGPANAELTAGGLALWDWERSTTGAPRGLDAAYCLVAELEPDEAIDELARLGVVEPTALVRLALLVVAHRKVVAADHGVPVRPEAVLDVLDALARP